jgi:hypothetical protein
MLQVPSSALQQSLSERLQAKCCRVAQWHTPHKDLPSEPAIQLARVGQLPSLLTQQREESERFHEEVEQNRKDCQEMVVKKHKVCDTVALLVNHLGGVGAPCTLSGHD